MDGTSGDDNKSQQSSSPMPQRKSGYLRSQQSQHIITRPGKSDSNKPVQKSAAQTSRDSRVDFERRMMFNSALGQGKSNEEAARYSGIKVEPGETLKSTDVMDLKYHGTPPKTRKRL